MIQGQLPFANAPAPLPGRFAHSPATHDFRKSLALSQRFSEVPWWMDIYRRAFPSLTSATCVRDDGWAQRAGIDRVLTLACGRVFTVDEKVRTNDWPDILLEQWSDEERRIAGWIQKPLGCDFIAYAFAQSRRCYLLPTALLQRAWRLNGRAWIELYGQRRTRNVGYISTSIPVPIAVLKLALAEAMAVRADG
jgi:hypothetical protein